MTRDQPISRMGKGQIKLSEKLGIKSLFNRYIFNQIEIAIAAGIAALANGGICMGGIKTVFIF